jgi:hypothetical protein
MTNVLKKTRTDSGLVFQGDEVERLLPGYKRASNKLYARIAVLGTIITAVYFWWLLPNDGALSIAMAAAFALINAWCLTFVGYSLTIIFSQGRSTIRVLGFKAFSTARDNWITSRKAGRRLFPPLVFSGILIVAAPLVAIGVWTGLRNAAGLLAFLCQLVVAHFWDLARPPVALILTTSTPEVLEMIVRIRGNLPLLRIVTLLDTSRGESDMAREYYKFDDFRTSGSTDWMEVVRRFAEMVPVIVMDVRHTSDPVLWEIALTLDEKYLSKVIYLIGDNGERDGLLIVANHLTVIEGNTARQVIVSTPSAIAAVLRRLILRREVSPGVTQTTMLPLEALIRSRG